MTSLAIFSFGALFGASFTLAVCGILVDWFVKSPWLAVVASSRVSLSYDTYA